MFDALLEQAQAQRVEQIAHWDALDTKAGLAIGFAGVLVGVTPGGPGLPSMLVRLVAFGAAAIALWAFWPRKIRALDIAILRDALVTFEASRGNVGCWRRRLR
jgi:hypothetical protein